ncbi:MAG: hypothetical protein JSW08_01475 [archaeon]|nr:MAG: hypothetical protein JSW08_01475 [archaeon]
MVKTKKLPLRERLINLYNRPVVPKGGVTEINGGVYEALRELRKFGPMGAYSEQPFVEGATRRIALLRTLGLDLNLASEVANSPPALLIEQANEFLLRANTINKFRSDLVKQLRASQVYFLPRPLAEDFYEDEVPVGVEEGGFTVTTPQFLRLTKPLEFDGPSGKEEISAVLVGQNRYGSIFGQVDPRLDNHFYVSFFYTKHRDRSIPDALLFTPGGLDSVVSGDLSGQAIELGLTRMGETNKSLMESAKMAKMATNALVFLSSENLSTVDVGQDGETGRRFLIPNGTYSPDDGEDNKLKWQILEKPHRQRYHFGPGGKEVKWKTIWYIRKGPRNASWLNPDDCRRGRELAEDVYSQNPHNW